MTIVNAAVRRTRRMSARRERKQSRPLFLVLAFDPFREQAAAEGVLDALVAGMEREEAGDDCPHSLHQLTAICEQQPAASRRCCGSRARCQRHASDLQPCAALATSPLGDTISFESISDQAAGGQ